MAGNTNTEALGTAARLTWALRDSLSPRDRAAVIALLGRNYPGWTSDTDRLEDAETAVELAPDSPMGWQLLGDMQYDFGRYISDSSLIRRGLGALDRALALDSSYAPAAWSRASAAIELGETEIASRLRERVEEAATGEFSALWEWTFAMALDDSAALDEARSSLGTTQREVTGVGYVTTELGLPYDEWEAATARFEANAVTDRARYQALKQRCKIAMLRGQSRRALAYTDSLIAEGWFVWAMHNFVIKHGMFGAGYDSAAAAKAEDLERLFNEGADIGEYAVRCTVGLWRAFTGDAEGARSAIRDLEEHVSRYGSSPKCPTAIRAMIEVDAEGDWPAVERLDSLLAIDISEVYNLVLARIRERQGDVGAALKAARRDAYIGVAVSEQLTHPFMLREQGRLDDLAGDTAAAVRAYEHYLAIRTDPDAAVQPEVDQVRLALAELVGEGRR